MSEDLQILIELQKIDREIKALSKLKNELPLKIGKIESAIKEKEKSILNISEKIKDNERARREANLELASIDTEIKQKQNRQSEVKTNKEYTSILHEIETLKKRKAEIEEKAILSMDNDEKLKAEISTMENNFKKFKAENSEKIKAIENQLDDIEKKLKEYLDNRNKIASKIKPLLFKRYERIRKARGTAVVEVVKDSACGGCYGHLPPQHIAQIKLMEEIMTCESCGRILVWKI